MLRFTEIKCLSEDFICHRFPGKDPQSINYGKFEKLVQKIFPQEIISNIALTCTELLRRMLTCM